MEFESYRLYSSCQRTSRYIWRTTHDLGQASVNISAYNIRMNDYRPPKNPSASVQLNSGHSIPSQRYIQSTNWVNSHYINLSYVGRDPHAATSDIRILHPRQCSLAGHLHSRGPMSAQNEVGTNPMMTYLLQFRSVSIRSDTLPLPRVTYRLRVC